MLCCVCARSQCICVCVITRFDIYTHEHHISAIRYSDIAIAAAFARTMCLNCRIGRSIRIVFMSVCAHTDQFQVFGFRCCALRSVVCVCCVLCVTLDKVKISLFEQLLALKNKQHLTWNKRYSIEKQKTKMRAIYTLFIFLMRLSCRILRLHFIELLKSCGENRIVPLLIALNEPTYDNNRLIVTTLFNRETFKKTFKHF